MVSFFPPWRFWDKRFGNQKRANLYLVPRKCRGKQMLGEILPTKKVGKKIKKSVDIWRAFWYSNKAPRETA